MLILQIRQAQVAINDGRLDEAFALLGSERLRSHRRGQALVTELVEALVRRGEAHAKAGRTSQALLDCERAQQLGGNLESILGLRSRIETDVLNADRERRQAARTGMLATAVKLVDSALGRADLDRAVGELVRARGSGCDDSQIRALDANVRSNLKQQIDDAIDEGRLDQIDPLLDRLTRLEPDSLETRQLVRFVEQARFSWAAIEGGRFGEAVESLNRLRVLRPNAKWISDAIKNVAVAEEAIRSVRSGPLGLIGMHDKPFRGDAPTAAPSVAAPLASARAQVVRAMDAPQSGLPAKFLLQVDGAGSFLVLTKPTNTFGPISSSRLPDVALIADATGQVISLERMEDDYFAREGAAGPRLLTSGDRITISPRCRLQFAMPHPSSTTATLDLLAGRFPRADVRRVILLDSDLVVGPSSSAHVRADHLKESVVFHVRDGNLFCRSQRIDFGVPTTVSGVSITLSPG